MVIYFQVRLRTKTYIVIGFTHINEAILMKIMFYILINN